jgi:protein TonB
MMARPGRSADRTRQAVSTAVAVLGHGVILAGILALAKPVPHAFQGIKPILITLERPKPPPKPKPPEPKVQPPTPPTPPPPAAVAPPKPPPPAPVHRAAKPAPAELHAEPGPPVHFFAPNGSAPPSSLPSGNGAGGFVQHAPSDYADRVNARIVAARTYPAEAKLKHRECVIPYRVTVDRQGNLLSYKIDPCNDPEINAAAEAAIKKAAPYDPPPFAGAEQYVIYHTQIFHAP